MITADASLAEIRAVHLAAFPTPEEANLVEQILADGEAHVSLGGRAGAELAGHILFSRLEFCGMRGGLLAPVAVKPRYQRQGIGSALIRSGLHQCRVLDLAFAAFGISTQIHP